MPDISHANSVSWELFNRENESLNTWALQLRAGVLISSRIQGDPACLMEVEIGGKQSAFSWFFPFSLIFDLHFKAAVPRQKCNSCAFSTWLCASILPQISLNGSHVFQIVAIWQPFPKYFLARVKQRLLRFIMKHITKSHLVLWSFAPGTPESVEK